MSATISTTRSSKSRSRPFSASRIEVAMTRRIDRIVMEWRRLIDRAFDGYRPERHYMRGPGPKWYAKHRAAGALA
jgi:hypothetical protein